MAKDIGILILGVVIGIIIGLLIARVFIKKYFKKNPPINEDMIKTLMMQMGRKPNQKQINQVMKSMNKYM